jgi:very-short-patch-repair endonuclease
MEKAQALAPKGTAMKPPRRIVRGQHIEPEKLVRAKSLRREMTRPEAMLWQRLGKDALNGLHFRRQQVVDGFILDFYCHQAALVVEVDGLVHTGQIVYDAERSAVLAGRGLRVLRVTNAEVEANLEAVLAQIAAVCAEQLQRD